MITSFIKKTNWILRLTLKEFFVGSSIAIILLCITPIFYFPIFKPDELKAHPELFYLNIAAILLFITLLLVYKKSGGRVAIVNVISLISFAGNPGIYELNGGIFAPDNMWGIIFSAWVFLVANSLSGIIWMGISLTSITYFFYADISGQKDFHADMIRLNSSYFYQNYLLAGIFLLLIISLYESSKKKFVADLKKSKAEIETRKKELELQKEDILSSINYAKRIQYAVLPHEDSIYRSIPLSFIVYKPRDIVSGDFFWFHEIDRDNYIIVCADCTGHGVPGAFMTVIGSSALNQIVVENKILQPSEILSELDKRITSTLKQEKNRADYVHDGMDLSLLKVNKSKKEFTFNSAKRPAIFIRNKQIQEIKGSKNTLGGLRDGEKKFDEIKMNFEEDDMIYLFTDGYIDQFGGTDNKKFMIKRFRDLLISSSTLSMNEQKLKLENTIIDWIGENEQTDDITVIGVRF